MPERIDGRDLILIQETIRNAITDGIRDGLRPLPSGPLACGHRLRLPEHDASGYLSPLLANADRAARDDERRRFAEALQARSRRICEEPVRVAEASATAFELDAIAAEICSGVKS